MEKNEIISILDKLTIEDSVSYILDGTISVEDVFLARIPLSVKEEIFSTYKQVLAIRERIVNQENEKKKIQSIESDIVSDDKQYTKTCSLVSKDFKYGYQTLEGRLLIPIEFEEIFPLGGMSFIVKYNGKYGCWHYGKKIADYRYDHIFFLEQLGCFQIGEIRKNGQEYWGLINCKGEILLSIENFNITLIDKTMVLVAQSYSKIYKFMTVSSDGKLEELYVSSDNYEIDGIRYYIVKNSSEKYGVLDANFCIVIPVEYELLKSVSFVWNKLFIAKSEGLYGVVDLKGNVIIPFVYDSIEFNNEEFIISKGGVLGIANKIGQIVLSVKYSHVGRLSNGLRPISIDSKWGYVDTKEKLIIPFAYDKAGDFFGNYTIVKKGHFYGVIDRSNGIIVPFKYKDIISYEDLDAIVVNEFGLEGVIDLKTGNSIPCQYAEIHPKFRDKTTCILRCHAYNTSHRYLSFCNSPKRRPCIVDVIPLYNSNSSTIDSQYRNSVSYTPKLDDSVILKEERTGNLLYSPLAWIRYLHKKHNVYSSIFAPSEINRSSFILVQVYLHLLEETEKVKALAQESDKKAERRDYIPLQCKLKKGDKVDLQLNIYGESLLMSKKKSVVWLGSFTKCTFDYYVPKDIEANELSCVAMLTVNGIPIGEMRFITRIVETPRQLNPEVVAHKYNKVFISYSHQDESKIKFLHEGLELGSVPHFFDRKYLKAGDVFPQVIKDYINSADLFILCWSENASKSEYVQKERLQALERAFPQVKPEQEAKLRIYPMSIEPHAELPSDMKENYHFGEI